MSMIGPMCIVCTHLTDEWTCPAFPDGIPGDVQYGYFDHRAVHPDQQGTTVFEPTDDDLVGIYLEQYDAGTAAETDVVL